MRGQFERGAYWEKCLIRRRGQLEGGAKWGGGLRGEVNFKKRLIWERGQF
jgi:hypothetical protein